ncbi:MAG: shikimate kinase, partial [Pyrinomonadaceae bacterium]
TGGGAWTLERNRSLVAAHDCLTVWLDAPFELCWKRIGDAVEDRPLARGRENAQRLYEERRAAYELAALHVCVMHGRSVEEIATEIFEAAGRL